MASLTLIGVNVCSHTLLYISVWKMRDFQRYGDDIKRNIVIITNNLLTSDYESFDKLASDKTKNEGEDDAAKK